MEGWQAYDPYQQNAPHPDWHGAILRDGHALSSVGDCTDLLSPTTTIFGPRTPLQRDSSSSSPSSCKDSKENRDNEWPPTAQASPQQRKTVLRSWWAEISSATLALLCIFAIVGILLRVEGKLLSSWTFAVSPNAVISILCTTTKAAMILPVAESISQLKWLHLHSSNLRLEQLQVFDRASRGPAGAIRFLIGARSASAVAYFGCFIVLFALALEPFTQQSLEYSSISTAVTYQNSSVSHSRIFDKWLFTDTSDYNVISNYRDQSIVAGGIAGLYGVIPAPPFSCPGANCTFPVVTSLGIRSVCEDVTAKTRASCINDNATKAQADVGGGHPNYCNYTLPRGAVFTEAASFSPHTGFFSPTMDIQVNNSILIREYNYTSVSTLSIIRFETNSSWTGPTTEWQDTMTAYQCTLELCAWSFSNWSYVNGKLKHGSTTQSKLLHTSGEAETFVMRYYTYKPLDPTFPRDSSGNNTYVLNSLDKDGILANIEELFETNYTADSLYQARDDIPAALNDFATGMTYNMMSGPNATLTYGAVLENMTYIHVRWPWLALCVAMIVLSTVFLVVTIVKTQMADIRPWKSSLSPLIFADPYFDDGEPVPEGKQWSDEHKYRRISTIKQVLG